MSMPPLNLPWLMVNMEVSSKQSLQQATSRRIHATNALNTPNRSVPIHIVRRPC